jgi:hypothetical protein
MSPLVWMIATLLIVVSGFASFAYKMIQNRKNMAKQLVEETEEHLKKVF